MNFIFLYLFSLGQFGLSDPWLLFPYLDDRWNEIAIKLPPSDSEKLEFLSLFRYFGEGFLLDFMGW